MVLRRSEANSMPSRTNRAGGVLLREACTYLMPDELRPFVRAWSALEELLRWLGNPGPQGSSLRAGGPADSRPAFGPDNEGRR